jgi:tetratricopeptide (TPR) repeat protein
VPPAVAAARAQHAIDRTLAVERLLLEAHLTAAELDMTRHDWAAAGREYRRAIDIAPRHSLARQQYALWLSYQGRFDEALEAARLAESLDPLSPSARNSVAEVLRHARRFDEAVVQAQRALELNPNFGRAHAVLGHCYFAQGKMDAAIEEHRRSGGSAGNLGYAYAVGEIAQVYIGLHQFESAFERLQRAVDDGSVWTLMVAVVWDPLRSDRRFDVLLRKAGYGN